MTLPDPESGLARNLKNNPMRADGRQPYRPAGGVRTKSAKQRSKSFCGAEPAQKLGWTDAGGLRLDMEF
jgi:hypothetical protein